MAIRKMLGSIQQSVVFGSAFRLFFLSIGAYAAPGMLGWGLSLSGLIPWPRTITLPVRHGHEMIFGFTGGAIAGGLGVSLWRSVPSCLPPPCPRRPWKRRPVQPASRR